MNNPVLILYLEDNPRDAELVRDKLQQIAMPHELRVTSDRAQYEAALAQTRFDLILSDYSQPDYDGMAALALAREKQPDVPFILITGTLGEEQAVDCMLRGATDFVLKQRLNRLVPAVLRTLTEADERQKRRVAEETLRQSEMKYRQLVETLQEGIWVIDKDSNTTFVNPHMAEMLGYTVEEMLGKPLFYFIDERGVEIANRNVERRKQGITERHDFEFTRKDGSRIHTTLTTSPITDEKGNYDGSIAGVNDITERERAEAAVRASEEKFRGLFEMTRDAIMTLDPPSWRFTSGNPATVKMFGAKNEEELISHGPWELSPERQPDGRVSAEKAKEMIETAVREGSHFFEWTHRRIGGMEFPADVLLTRIKQGGTVMLHATVRDITERKRAAAEKDKIEGQLRQAQKMEAIGLLAGGVAHDFNNMLQAILGTIELLLEATAADDPRTADLNEILTITQRSADLTRQLLAFARKQVIAPRVLDLNKTVAAMLKMLRRLIGEDITLAWLPSANLRPVKLDPSQVDQILANLCVNARAAIAGVGKITLETGNFTFDADYCASHADAIPGEYVFLAVSDTGGGMAPETLAQVFEPFFTTKGIGRGTGLGLATVYGIVKQNHGFIYAYSELGQGATFKIYLPQVADAAVETAAISTTDTPKGRGETILLAEDENSLRVTCKRILEALGYNVLPAETPGDALKLAERHPGEIALLLTDVVMPGMDGRQLAQRLDAARPGIRVLFMSGYTADVIVKRGVLEKNVAFIAKPFTRDALARKVREVLDFIPPAVPPPCSQ